MTAHTRTASLSPSIGRTIGMRTAVPSSRASTGRFVLIAASVRLQAVIVLGFVASSLGIGGTAYRDPGPGRLAPPAPTAPLAITQANQAPVLEPAPAPAPPPVP
jgi:hypothetical protein